MIKIDMALYLGYGVWIDHYTEVLDFSLKSQKINKKKHKKLCMKLEQWNDTMDYYFSVS